MDNLRGIVQHAFKDYGRVKVKLAEVLEHAIPHPDQLAAMKADCRKMYETYYSNEAYVATLTRLVNELTT